MPAAGGPVHSVSFRYSFDGEPSVRISGLGAMPATGELSYLTPDAVIRFTAADGRQLESIDLKNATELMGEAASATPARSDFRGAIFADNFRSLPSGLAPDKCNCASAYRKHSGLILLFFRQLLTMELRSWRGITCFRWSRRQTGIWLELIERQPSAGLVHHSDRGVQYASHAYTEMLEATPRHHQHEP